MLNFNQILFEIFEKCLNKNGKEITIEIIFIDLTYYCRLNQWIKIGYFMKFYKKLANIAVIINWSLID